MKKNKTWFQLFFSFALLPALAQQGNLDYTAFIQSVMKVHPLATRAGNESAIGTQMLKSARGQYDPALQAEWRQKYYNSKNYYSILHSEIKQPIFTSQYFKAGYDYGNLLYPQAELSTPASGIPYAGMEVALLQGLVTDKRRTGVLKGKEYQNLQQAESRTQYNDLLVSAAGTYFEWLFHWRTLKLNAYFQDLARQRLIAIETMAAAGEEAPIDTVEAAIFYQARTLDYQNALSEIRKSGNELQSYLWSAGQDRPTAIQDLPAPADSLDICYEKVRAILLGRLGQGITQNPVLEKYRSMRNIYHYEGRYRRELIKPQLNVSYNFLSYNNTWSMSPDNYKWGVQFAMPLFRNVVSEYRIAQLQKNNYELELLSKDNELNRKMQALSQVTSVLSEQILNAQRAASYSKKLLEAEKLKFANGESSLFLLNTRESKWLESEIKLAEYKLKFLRTALQVIYLNGDLAYDF